MQYLGRASAVFPTEIHKDKDSCFGISFPDFPGCITAGNTLNAAKGQAKESLQFHIEGMVEDGLEVPIKSAYPELMRDNSVFKVKVRV